jgi:hypothetical protein
MPIVLGIIAIVALVGGGIFFFSAGTATEPPAVDSEEAARIDSEEQTKTTPEDQEATSIEVGVETVVETSARDTSINRETETMMEREEMPMQMSSEVFSAEATYLTPSRTSHKITVNLTVSAAGIITNSEVTYDDGAGYSNGHQERFDKAYMNQINGKALSEINLSRVGGASLTSEAFNEAITKIEAQQA